MVVTVATLPMVTMFGNDQRAWIITAVIFAVIALILLLICFFNIEERSCCRSGRKRKNTGRKEPEGTVFQSILGYLSWTLGIHGNDEYSIRYDCNLLLQICIT